MHTTTIKVDAVNVKEGMRGSRGRKDKKCDYITIYKNQKSNEIKTRPRM